MVQHGSTIVQHSPYITTAEALQFEETAVGDYFYDNTTVDYYSKAIAVLSLRSCNNATGLARYQSTTGSVLEYHYGSTTAWVLYYDSFNATTASRQHSSITTALIDYGI
eukprot:6485925-Pyramimonas_sp.AAC.1